MTKFLAKVFSNNGIARGLIYFSIASLTPIGESFVIWSNKPPSNWYEIGGVAITAAVSGLVAIRAYMDGHLARSKPPVADSTKSGPIAPS